MWLKNKNMSQLSNLINEDVKNAMRAKDEKTLGALRMLISALRNKEISLRSGEKVELSDEQVVEVVGSEVKKRKDSIVSYEQGGRNDLAEQERSEIAILEKYLPTQATDEEIMVIVNEIISANSGANFGVIMGQAMAKLKGQADGNRVTAIVKKAMETK